MEPLINPILNENKISGSSSPVAKIEMNTAIVPNIKPATTEIEMASLVEMSVTPFEVAIVQELEGWDTLIWQELLGDMCASFVRRKV